MDKSKLKGRVHSFETFGAVDGPGIRFVVFMQGCALRCKYCHNRDTWDIRGGTEYTVEEIIQKALRCKPYMDATGNGGITVSGGEPLLQASFVTELFKAAHKAGMTTCLDTSGNYYIDEEIEELLRHTDYVLLDIKHIDAEKCRKLTGFSNVNELDFARYLSSHKIKIWIRQVLVPGYTDDEQDLIKTRQFIDTLKTVERVEVLPYHDYGKDKWTSLGLKYPLEGVKTPTREELQKAKEILEFRK